MACERRAEGVDSIERKAVGGDDAVVLVWAADAGAKALRKAVVTGVGLIKGGGAEHLAVAVVGAAQPISSATAQALAPAVSDATYVYRATKPSAPVAPKLSRVSSCPRTLTLPSSTGPTASPVCPATLANPLMETSL